MSGCEREAVAVTMSGVMVDSVATLAAAVVEDTQRQAAVLCLMETAQALATTAEAAAMRADMDRLSALDRWIFLRLRWALRAVGHHIVLPGTLFASAAMHATAAGMYGAIGGSREVRCGACHSGPTPHPCQTAHAHRPGCVMAFSLCEQKPK